MPLSIRVLASLDTPRVTYSEQDFSVLTRRNERIRNMALISVSDTPSVVEFHGHLNSTKLLISRSGCKEDRIDFGDVGHY